MASSQYLNARQYAFFRDLRDHADGVPKERCPRPALLQRWMQQPRFREYLQVQMASSRTLQRLATRQAAQQAVRSLNGALADRKYRDVADLLRVLRAD